VNGAYVQEVSSRSAVVAGTFYVDSAADRIYLRLSDSSSPTSKTVEVTSTSGPLLTTNGQSYIYLQSLNFAHCANGPQDTAAVRLAGGNHCQFSTGSVQWAAGAGITINGDFHTVTGSVFNNNGQLGIHATRADDCLVLNSETSYNNTHAGKQFDPGWEAGGNKFSRTNRFVVDGLLAHDNHGSGIWFDVANENGTITNSKSYLNRCGIHYEISYTGLITNNLCYNNRVQGADINSPVGQGIYISSSAGCRVFNNTVWGNGTRGIDISGPLRDDGNNATVYSYATTVRNNICGFNQVENTNAKDFSIGTSTTPNSGLTNTVVPFAPNSSDYNLFYRTDGRNFFSAGGNVYPTLSGYSSATGFDQNSRWGDPAFKSVSSSDFHLTSTSPALNNGIALAEVFEDFDGVTRPQGDGYDIGAYEKASFFFETETLAVTRKSSDVHRTFTNVALSGGAASILDSDAVGDFVIYNVPMVPPGTYNVRIGIKKQDTRGIWQLSVGRADSFDTTKSNVGSPQDEYASDSQYLEVNLGQWAPGSATSDKWFKFTVTGKNSSSSSYTMAFDYILLVPAN
jgi:parallel beta-helix repeat protein